MRIQTLLLVATVSFSVLVAGCSGGEETPNVTPDPEDAPAATTEPAGTASIAGTINFSGTAPARPAITLDRDCRALHEEDVLTENTVVNDNGTLRWAFVYVKDGLGDRTFAPPAEEVTFDQRGCMYAPHVFGVQVGQTVRIINSDTFLHNVNSQPDERSNKFNFGMPSQGMEKEQKFRTAEVMVKIRCDVHGWMGAYVGVMDHPYFAVSGDDGSFSLTGLPAGTYTLEAWHETLGTQTMEVTVGDDEAATADFTFAASS